jgi:hypothetical protein
MPLGIVESLRIFNSRHSGEPLSGKGAAIKLPPAAIFPPTKLDLWPQRGTLRGSVYPYSVFANYDQRPVRHSFSDGGFWQFNGLTILD